MAGITLAWLIGETIIIWRKVGQEHRPPSPGVLLGSSAFFALLALVAEYQPARPAATLLAFGIDLAAWLQVPAVTGTSTPASKPGGASKAPAEQAAGQGGGRYILNT